MSNSMALKIHQILQCLHTFPVGEMQHRVAEFCYCVCLYKNTHSIKVAQKSTRVASTGNVFCSMQNSKTIDLYPLQHFHKHFYTLLYAFIRFYTLFIRFHTLFICFHTHSNGSTMLLYAFHTLSFAFHTLSYAFHTLSYAF